MKPGDLVMVVRPRTPAFAGAVGRLLEVRQYKFISGAETLGVKVRFPRPLPWKLQGCDPCQGWMKAFRVIVINDPPGQDETLTWCPVPQPIKETA